MAKGSVRKKGKKWYCRFYIEDASGKLIQKEYAGTESKSETEKLKRKQDEMEYGNALSPSDLDLSYSFMLKFIYPIYFLCASFTLLCFTIA